MRGPLQKIWIRLCRVLINGTSCYNQCAPAVRRSMWCSFWPPNGQRNLQEPPFPLSWHKIRVLEIRGLTCNPRAPCVTLAALVFVCPTFLQALLATDILSLPSLKTLLNSHCVPMDLATIVSAVLLFNAVDALSIGQSAPRDTIVSSLTVIVQAHDLKFLFLAMFLALEGAIDGNAIILLHSALSAQPWLLGSLSGWS